MVRIGRMLSALGVALAVGWAAAGVAGPAEDLINAASRGETRVVQALLSNGASVNAKDNDGKTAVYSLRSRLRRSSAGAAGERGHINAKTNLGATPLMAAAFDGHRDVVQALLAKGADVNAKNSSGVTALMGAAFKAHRDVVQALLAKGADINAQADNGVTALTLARDAKIRALLVKAPSPRTPN